MGKIDPLVRLLHKNGLLESLPDQSVLALGEKGPIARLAAKGLLDEMQAIKLVAEKLGMEYCDLTSTEVTTTMSVNDFKSLIETSFCRDNKLVPLRKTLNGVIVAFANPLDVDALRELEFGLSAQIKPVIASEEQILRILDKYWASALTEALKEAGEYEDLEFVRGGGGKEEEAELDGQDVAPIVRLVNEILIDAVGVKASDIHIEPNKTHLDVRFRIDGVMQKILEIPKRLQPYLISRIKIVSAMDVSEKRRPQDGRLGVKMNNEMVDMRVSTIPTSFGEKVVLRIMRSDFDKLKFKDLGLPQKIESSLEEILNSHSRLLLVTGPTGSGKTTTLYTAINYLRDGKKNITTVEDPIEFKFEGVNQIQLNRAIDVTFASSLRSILRQDPDIIMIGEIRDAETINIAMQAALTGHLVLSTLHTNDAPSAITRIQNLGADPFIASQCLAGILAQRLVRKICTNCSQSLTSVDIDGCRQYLDAYNINPKNLKKATGCDKCFHTGYKGRLGVYSYLEVSTEIARLMSQQSGIDDIILAARKGGFSSIDEAAADIFSQGLTSFDEVKGYLSIEAKTVRSSATPLATRVPSQEIVQPTPKAQPSGKIKVLLIDDSPHVRKLLKVILEKEKFEVVEADNGKIGLERVKGELPALVLCDLSMPIMNGEEFLRTMKGGEDTKSTPVIMLTGDATAENESNLLKLGATDFMSKRSSPAVLVSRVKKALESRN